ncbi:PQQ-dependent sugar dehydrogenase, partial [Candidatus Pelagibacter bacterium]
KVLRENEFDTKPQDNKSIFGKVLLIDTKSFKYEIFNKGHRNSIGLLVEKDLIISTENGPRGGDEINIEKKGGNYGWNDASYGKKYFSEGMFLDHETAGFEEPVFTFIPSLAITEIIRLNNNFTEEWQDNYLIGSLNGRHLLRLKFNKEKSKVLYIEKIFIGERIRDLLYDEKNKIILLALEETGSIGVISK